MYVVVIWGGYIHAMLWGQDLTGNYMYHGHLVPFNSKFSNLYVPFYYPMYMYVANNKTTKGNGKEMEWNLLHYMRTHTVGF